MKGYRIRTVMIENNNMITLESHSRPGLVEINLPASKSIANRALLINALSGGEAMIGNLSTARDTQTMKRLLGDADAEEWDVLDAGTTMRFLTAGAAVTSNGKVMTGTPRMKERPIGVLVEALRLLGAKINYMENAGYPPLKIRKLTAQQVDRLNVRGDISSQYISALMMIGPVLPEGLTLQLQGTINSRPYIDMTMAVMKHYGANVSWEDERTVRIEPSGYTPNSFEVEPDWSAASYWYSMAAFAPGQTIRLKGLVDDSIQGDRKMAEIMEQMGVSTRFDSTGATLKAGDATSEIEIDFADCPDIAQTVSVIAMAKNTRCHMTGLESLRIKETDRIHALQQELGKFGGRLVEHDIHHWELIPPGTFSSWTDPVEVATYHDHRMAMSFAPLARFGPLVIEDASVVNKSYPHFWEDLQKAGLGLIG